MKRLLGLIFVILVLAAVWWGLTRNNSSQPTAFLGYVEGETLYIGPNEGERLAQLFVAAGSVVKPGDRLFNMSTTLLDRSRAEAVARIGQLEAQVQNLQAAINRPQQIAVLQAALERAEASLTLSRNDYDRQRKLFATGDISKSTLDRAEMALRRDDASVKEARRQVEAARIPGRSQEIEAAQASLNQAHAQLQAIDIRIGRQNVVAPAGGVVQDVFFRPGEVVNAGQPVVALLPPENRKVRFYVPEPRLAGVRLGARARVQCDGCPADLYGRISFVASRQEYTPPVIFSDVERAKLVFKVEARLEGKARELPLGMPVSVTPLMEATEAGK
ncbi:HlyD family efflux transporter periplasmic adaptor subunit [Methylocystis sp. MJC1]|jgi:HlyD family secretion protein|uniref:HlyD family secretion protein n=1 Tax=Methylocystis sp. MJC1 TaxID=2654282 RepID=UPI0013EB098D|nr:HlyD family efflux transporter periplasmic adaptor subunit [Methylocystis sp. MJC1]KAF2990365.1 Multidrug export protein EmrA [Methylocystis sp. MJC1]MBU6528161.1 HlyD family efflux transporter periplasmic adaptor subunit [Methylocystis sp. MJC1]UZX11072.1 HlyD family efflux transporter periplasmic adaptor subunit [Methylocystis sp. MJC1]